MSQLFPNAVPILSLSPLLIESESDVVSSDDPNELGGNDDVSNTDPPQSDDASLPSPLPPTITVEHVPTVPSSSPLQPLLGDPLLKAKRRRPAQTPKLSVPLNPTRTQVPKPLTPIPLQLGHGPLLAASTFADALLGTKRKHCPQLAFNYLRCLSLPDGTIGSDIPCAPDGVFETLRLVSGSRMEEILGYKFKCPNLLKLARINHSVGINSSSNNNEGLEFLGDAVLQMISTHWLYFNFSNVPEGILTVLRIGLVNNQFLARQLWRRFDAVGVSVCEVLLLSSSESQVDDSLAGSLRKFEAAMRMYNRNDATKDFNIQAALRYVWA